MNVSSKSYSNFSKPKTGKSLESKRFGFQQKQVESYLSCLLVNHYWTLPLLNIAGFLLYINGEKVHIKILFYRYCILFYINKEQMKS